MEDDSTIEVEFHKDQSHITILKADDEIKFSRYIMLSHFITRIADKSYEFMIPLFLIYISPNSLLPVSLFGVSITLGRIIFGSLIGNLCDKFKKIQVIKLGILGQAISIGASCIIFYFLLNINNLILLQEKENNVLSTSSIDLFSNNISIFLFVFLLLFSSIHSLSGQLMDISIERKWTPSIIKRDTLLSKVNTMMRQIDLATEVIAPFLVGLLMTQPTTTTDTSFNNYSNSYLVIGIFNFISFFPQYILLKIVYDQVSKQNLKIESNHEELSTLSTTIISESIYFTDGLDLISIFNNIGSPNNLNIKSILFGEWNPIINIYKGWKIFRQQQIFLVMSSYIILYLTVLSPHDLLMTSFLYKNGSSANELSMFRLMGAIVGLGSTTLYSRFIKFIGNIDNAAQIYILEEGLFITLSGFYFSSDISTSRIIFMIAIILSRCGLYGFELCEIQYVQRQVDNKHRGIVSGVESSLTSLSTLFIFLISIIFHNINNFYILVILSIICINTSVLLFYIWNKNQNNHHHYHQQIENK